MAINNTANYLHFTEAEASAWYRRATCAIGVPDTSFPCIAFRDGELSPALSLIADGEGLGGTEASEAQTTFPHKYICLRAHLLTRLFCEVDPNALIATSEAFLVLKTLLGFIICAKAGRRRLLIEQAIGDVPSGK